MFFGSIKQLKAMINLDLNSPVKIPCEEAGTLIDF